jgi:hypothetical protein
MAQPDEASGEAAGDKAVGESATETDALLSRLRLIEDQPLDQRAAAFAQIHDELQSALEGGDSPVRNA